MMKGGMANTATTAQRIRICHHCEHYDKGQQRCKLCGCFVRMKARVALAECPADKWPTLKQEAKGISLSSKRNT